MGDWYKPWLQNYCDIVSSVFTSNIIFGFSSIFPRSLSFGSNGSLRPYQGHVRCCSKASSVAHAH
ncbi:hypothetical protein GBA52_028453 [Prunus armeniaca]|nr:hypothetical protein GBA52_028453 [Prunus armeniaca]